MAAARDVEQSILQTDASGAPVRLEYVRGRTKWEASPDSPHQKAVQRIERAIARHGGPNGGGCGCFTLIDVLIRFNDPDRSLTRPDIAVFCEEPPDGDQALESVPAAVIEVLSVGYEEKALGDVGAPFYIAAGVADVLVIHPCGGQVLHNRAEPPPPTSQAPVTLDLSCGCRVGL
jgi:Uma2 family endonuclease